MRYHDSGRSGNRLTRELIKIATHCGTEPHRYYTGTGVYDLNGLTGIDGSSACQT